MVLASVDLFVESLREIRILRNEQFDQLVHDFAPKFEETQELAKHIVRLGWITLYQAKKILSGHAQELVLGNYVITEKIGEGGMGKVYKAKQLRLSRMVALKIIRPNLLENEMALKRFHREAKSAAQLAHPNIVRLFDADHVGDRHFLAMEFVEGTDLAKLIKDNGSLPIGMTCSFIRQAANGLQHAHDMGLVHRDIKPSNLLVTAPSKSGKTGAGGVVKILDMGLARAVATPEEADSEITALTQDGTVIGTPDFMSPEQAKNSSTVDGRSDLYSLGCTFYCLLTGHAPFPKGSTLEKLLQHQMDPPTHVQLLRQDVPNEVASILHRLLAKRPEDRFQSGSALATALEPWSVFDVGNQRLTISQEVTQPAIALSLPAANTPTSLDRTRTTAADPFDFDDLSDTPAPSAERKEKAQGPYRKKRPTALIAGIAGGLLLLIVGIVVAWRMNKKDKDPQSTPETPTANQTHNNPQPKKKGPPPTSIVKNELEPIDRYLPADTAMVAVVSIQQLQKSKFFQDQVLTQLEPHLANLRVLVGFDPLKSIDRVVFAVPESNPKQVVIVAQGYDFLTSDFLGWVGALPGVEIAQEKVAGQGMKQVYRFPSADTEKDSELYGAILSGINPSTIVLSPSKDRVLKALARIERQSETSFDDSSVKQMLAKYASKSSSSAASPPTLWMCVGCETKLLGFFVEKKSKQIGSPRDGGILELIASVSLGESLDFEVSIEATRRPAAVQGWERITTIMRLLSVAMPEQRVKRAIDLIAGAKMSKDQSGKATAAVVTWVNRIEPDKMSEWFAPFLGNLPTPANAESP